MTIRYDTLVIEGATSKEVPREAAGGRVVSWAQGHGLAEANVLEAFVQQLVGGELDDDDWDEVLSKAQQALDKARRYRDNGYED